MHGLSLVAASQGYSLLWCMGFSLRWLFLLQSTGSRHAGFSLWWLLLLWSMGSRHVGFSSCSTWALECAGFSSCSGWAQWLRLAGSRAWAQKLWHMGLVAQWHVGSSQTRDRTHVPCIGRQILNHCITREVHLDTF